VEDRPTTNVLRRVERTLENDKSCGDYMKDKDSHIICDCIYENEICKKTDLFRATS